MKLHYATKTKQNARNLRNNLTKSEVLLWLCIKGKQLGYRFIRQKPINKYIVDFYSKELKLAIEIDGGYHEYIDEQDQRRQQELESLGIRFLRFSASDVEKSPEGVAQLIREFISKYY